MTFRHKHADSTLIDRVGKGIVREQFGLTPQALWQWRDRGIPLTKRIAFAKLAADHGVTVPADFFEKLNETFGIRSRAA